MQVQQAQIKYQIRVIFTFYSSFGDRTNITQLKSNRFHKMMSDANIKDQILTQRKLDLLFVQENKHKSNMQYATFLNLLPKISAIKYPNLRSEQSIFKLYSDHLKPLYFSIMEKTDLGQDLRSFHIPINEECITLIKPLSQILSKIYQVIRVRAANPLPRFLRSCHAPTLFAALLCRTRSAQSLNQALLPGRSSGPSRAGDPWRI